MVYLDLSDGRTALSSLHALTHFIHTIQGLVTFDSTVIEHLLVPGPKDPALNKTKIPALMGFTF